MCDRSYCEIFEKMVVISLCDSLHMFQGLLHPGRISRGQTSRKLPLGFSLLAKAIPSLLPFPAVSIQEALGLQAFVSQLPSSLEDPERKGSGVGGGREGSWTPAISLGKHVPFQNLPSTWVWVGRTHVPRSSCDPSWQLLHWSWPRPVQVSQAGWQGSHSPISGSP